MCSRLHPSGSLVFALPLLWSFGVHGCSASSARNDLEGQPNGDAGSGGNGGNGGNGGVPFSFDGGTVEDACAEAAGQRSSVGCEFWPTVTSNPVYIDFEFAVVATNPTTKPLTVTVERNGSSVAQRIVEPGQLGTIKLPWVPELKQSPAEGELGDSLRSALVPGGGYKVTSSAPITLVQFNPLDFELSSGQLSYSNDASLLLPKTALRNEYYVMSYPTWHFGSDEVGWRDYPGFVAITATEDGTSVAVTASGYVRAGTGVAALSPGQKGNYTLDAGDVLMLESGVPPAQPTPLPDKPCTGGGIEDTLCPTGPDYDLTGTRIQTNKPVSVIGGHHCTLIPYTHRACDHLEESIFPVDMLGKDVIIAAPATAESFSMTPDSMFLRVLSAADGNLIHFDPPVSPPVTLDAGQWVELGPLAQDVAIKASGKILVGQYMVGSEFSGSTRFDGDPSMSIGIPTEQYRSEYTFLAPVTYRRTFVNVVAPTGTAVSLDGAAIVENEFHPVGASGLSVARHYLDRGQHTITSEKKFGIVVYGYGEATSYMVPGGLNLEPIVITPN